MSDYILTMLKADLGELFPDEARTEYLIHNIEAAKTLIKREGVCLRENIEDLELVEMYDAYLIRKRATNEGMPRMLRYALNNRLFGQKAVQNGS